MKAIDSGGLEHPLKTVAGVEGTTQPLITEGQNYTSGTTSDRMEEIDPVDQHDLPEEILNDTAQGDGTTYAYFDLAHISSFSTQVEDTPGAAGNNTYTLELTNETAGTVATRTYHDATAAYLSAATFTASFHETTKITCRATYGRWKRVRAADGGGADGASVITLRKGP